MKAFVFLLLCSSLHAEHRLWRWSVAALCAGSAADAASSWGRAELNPVLGSRFDGRAVAIKGGITFGVVMAEALIVRRHRETERAFTVVNFAGAGVTGAVAVRNWRLDK